MKRRDISLTLALCGSIIVHAAVTEMMAEAYIRRAGRIYLPGFGAQAASVGPASFNEPDLGDAHGDGDALDSSSGELPQQAVKADQTQAFLGLDPQGSKARAGASADAWQQAAASPLPAAPAQSETSPFGVTGDAGDLHTGADPARAAAPVTPSPQATPSTPAGPTGAPAEQALTESDPVSVTAGAEFRPGKTEIQYGRDHKITRPHLSLAAQADLMSIARPLLTLKIVTDATGHVQNVAIFKTSGSANVDEGCKLAAYNWWFEPAKDRAASPHGDVILFSIRFF